MPEITIKYTDSKILKMLKALSGFFDFSVSAPKKGKKEELVYINGVPMVPGNASVDISDMGAIISRNNMNAKKLRQEAWQRKMNAFVFKHDL